MQPLHGGRETVKHYPETLVARFAMLCSLIESSHYHISNKTDSALLAQA